MANELQTRRLIVTMPDTSGEEADTACSTIEDHLMDAIYADRSAHGLTVTHALGEAVLAGSLRARGLELETAIGHDDRIIVNAGDLALNPDEARELAGALLALAADVEAAVSHLRKGICQHCGHLIEREGGLWIDPAADGDDAMWRETCADHDTFTAQHEPYPATTNQEN